MADYKNIYVSEKKLNFSKKKITIDEDCCKLEEKDAIKSYLNSFSQETRDKYNKGKKITLYLYALSKDNIAYPYKSIDVEKDGDDFSVEDNETFEVPDDFVPWGEDDNKTDNDDAKTDDEKDDESEDEENDDDDEELKEACELSDRLIDLYEAGVISGNTLASLSVMLEAVVGRRTIAQLKEEKKKETRDRRLYLKAHSHAQTVGENHVSDKEQAILKTRKWVDAWSKEDEAKRKLNEARNSYYDMRAKASERLKEAKKERREKDIDNMKNKIKDKFNHKIPPTTATVESMLLDMNSKFKEDDYYSYVLNESAIIAATVLNMYDFEPDTNESLSYTSEKANQILNEIEESGAVTEISEKIGMVMVNEYMTEKTLKSKDRKALDDSEFGIPETRSYPIHDKVHVRAAIMMFNKVDPKYEKELASNLIQAMKKFGMLNSVHVGKNNRFKQYIDKEYKNFKESYDTFSFPVNLTEFSAGSLLPTSSNTGWGEVLDANKLDEMIKDSNQDAKKYAELYDTVEINQPDDFVLDVCESTEEEYIAYESLIPQRNITFDGEVEKLMSKLKEFVNNPKNDYLETILKKAINYKKTVYTIHLKDQKGDGANKVISKIKSCGFKEVNDEGVKAIYDKETHGILITVIYDTVTDKIRITYEYSKERPKMEFVEFDENDDYRNNTLHELKIKHNALKEALYSESSGMIEKFRVKYTKFGKYVAMIEKYYMDNFKDFVPFDHLSEEMYLHGGERFYNGEGDLYLANSKKGKAVNRSGGKIIFYNNDKAVFECVITVNVEKGPGYISGSKDSVYGQSYTEIINRIKTFNFIDAAYKKFENYYKSKFYLKYNIDGSEVFESLKRDCIKFNLINKSGKTITEYAEDIIIEASKEEIDDDIKPVINILNKKGYNTKYSCSGHLGARIKKDGLRNGIYKGKLYTTARVVFDKDYDIGAPKGWKLKTFDGQIGIYPEPPHYKYSDGIPNDAWEKWKAEYLSELKVWANNLGDKPGPEEDK